MANKVRNLPSSEDGHGVLCRTKSGKEFVISQNTAKCRFTLWEMLADEYRKIQTADSPLELYPLVPWKG